MFMSSWPNPFILLIYAEFVRDPQSNDDSQVVADQNIDNDMIPPTLLEILHDVLECDLNNLKAQ